MASVFVPVFYVLVLFGGLFVFGHFYRKRNASMGLSTPGYVAVRIRLLMPRTFIRPTNRALLLKAPRERHLCHPPSAYRSPHFRCFIESRARSARHRGRPANPSDT